MKKNGFTLIELLAVIVILSIIALISVPLIMNVIDDSKKGAFKNTAYGIIKAAELSYTSDTLSGNKRVLIFTYNDGVETSNVDGKKLEYKGQKPRNGIVKINEKGEISLYIHNGKYCIEKKYDDIEVTISEKSAAECTDPRYNFSKQKVLEGYIPIANANELYNIRDNASNVFGLGTEWENTYTGGLNKKYVQVDDISLSSYENWEPIGNYTTKFTGTYDGNGYEISNLKINRPTEDYLGLFGYINEANIYNINIMNGNVIGRDYVGLLVGCSYSTNVDNVVATGLVFGKDYVGGLAGELWNYGKSLNNLAFAGEVEATNQRVGLLTGMLASGTHLKTSYATGNVEGKDYVGGLVGTTGDGSKFSNSYSRANVFGSGTYVGGLVGYLYNSSITNCYSASTIGNGGGLVGGGSTNITNSYWDAELAGITTGNRGTPKTTAEMKQLLTYEGWDFDIVWEINPNKNNGYPINISDPMERYVGYIPIASAEELNNIRLNERKIYGKGTPLEGEYLGGLDRRYIQVGNIDLSSYDNWEPIGNNTTEFTGIYNGNGYTISNLKINRPTEDYIGLFGYINEANIYNINIMNGNVIGRDYVGLLVGCSYSTNVDNVVATGLVFGKDYVGGLAGELWNYGKSLNNLAFAGEVEATNQRAGLLTGMLASGTHLKTSYATGNVKGKDYVGGLVGTTGDGSKFSNSYSRANVFGSGTYVGGLVGYLYNSSITNCYSASTIGNGGGLVGNGSTNITNSYWDAELAGITTGNRGTPKTTAEMKQLLTYEGWDFTNIWGINANINNGYPYLR